MGVRRSWRSRAPARAGFASSWGWSGMAGPPLGASIAVALVLRVAALLAALPDPARLLTLDGREYLALARDPVGGYLDPTSPLFSLGLFRTPVYPLAAAVVLRLAGGHLQAVIAAQVL